MLDGLRITRVSCGTGKGKEIMGDLHMKSKTWSPAKTASAATTKTSDKVTQEHRTSDVSYFPSVILKYKYRSSNISEKKTNVTSWMCLVMMVSA